MDRLQLVKSLGDWVKVRQIESQLVRYTFDFSFKEHRAGELLLYELGRNDVDIPIVLEPNSKNVYLLDVRGVSFINSSFGQMIRSLEKVNELNWIPDDLPDEERAKIFAEVMEQIDPNCFHDVESCWSTMREEIANGVI